MKRKPHAASRADIVFVNHSGHMTSEPYLVSNLQNDVKWLGSMHSPPLSPFSHLCDFPSPELLWQSKPSLLQPFPAEGQQVQSGFMRSLLPPRAGSVTDSCLHHGQGLWQWEKANPLHSLGHQWSHGWSGRGAVLPVSKTLYRGRFLRWQRVGPWCWELLLHHLQTHWGPCVLSMAGVPAAAALQPLRGQLQGGHPLCMCSVTGGCEVFGSNWKKKKIQPGWISEREDSSRLADMLMHVIFKMAVGESASFFS